MSSQKIASKATTGRLSLRLFLKHSSALLLLCPMMLLASCSTTTTQFVKVPVTPLPAALLKPCLPSPPPSDKLTYGDSVLWNELLLTDIQNCNAQLDGISKAEQERSK